MVGIDTCSTGILSSCFKIILIILNNVILHSPYLLALSRVQYLCHHAGWINPHPYVNWKQTQMRAAKSLGVLSSTLTLHGWFMCTVKKFLTLIQLSAILVRGLMCHPYKSYSKHIGSIQHLLWKSRAAVSFTGREQEWFHHTAEWCHLCILGQVIAC